MPKKPTDITQTPAFQRWFAGSKVVDAAGRPLRVYHGTSSHFEHFSHEDIPYRGGILAFFSTSPEFASGYAVGGGSGFTTGAHVMPCYLRILEPFDFRQEAWLANDFWEETGGIQDQYDRNRILMGLGHDVELDAPNTEHLLTQDQFFELIKQGSWDALEAEDFVHWLRHDHDGIITLENNAVNYAIFNANQVKSAIGSKFTNKPGISESTTIAPPMRQFLSFFNKMKVDRYPVMMGVGRDYEFEHVDVGFNLRPVDNQTVVLQDLIAKYPQSGEGSSALELLCSIADRYGVIIDLDAGPYSTRYAEPMPREKLMAWYGRFGFVPVAHSEMRRIPINK